MAERLLDIGSIFRLRSLPDRLSVQIGHDGIGHIAAKGIMFGERKGIGCTRNFRVLREEQDRVLGFSIVRPLIVHEKAACKIPSGGDYPILWENKMVAINLLCQIRTVMPRGIPCVCRNLLKNMLRVVVRAGKQGGVTDGGIILEDLTMLSPLGDHS